MISLYITQTLFKGIVPPKIKIQSLSTLPHADGRSGEVLLVYKMLLEFQRKKTLQ